MTASLVTPTVADLFIHPLKSGRAVRSTSATLDSFGFVGDRRLLAVDERGTFLTQRTVRSLAHLSVSIAPDGHSVTLSAPGNGALSASLSPVGLVARRVVVWNDQVDALDLGESCAEWMTRFLERPARLVAMGPGYSRPVRDTGNPVDHVTFADAFPLLIVSEASLADLNERLDFPVPMDRFRPNIVVRGCEAFAEDRWKRIRIGDIVLRAAGPCSRCVVITTDQETLEIGKEPLRTLSTYRRGDNGKVYFGQNYVNESKTGTISVGMPVEVLES